MPIDVLILGGTAEARQLATELPRRHPDLRCLTSLAGRTDLPPSAGETRIGGFGGTEGLAEFLREENVRLLIDATHPFARRISAQAREAAESAGVPRLALARPMWPRLAEDRWIEAESWEDMARLVPNHGRRVFLTIGVQELGHFAHLEEIWFLVRLISAPKEPILLPNAEILFGRPPYSPDTEIRLMRDRGIDLLVAKASGGAATEAKIAAARTLGLPVLMLKRPPPEPGESAETVAAALAWLESQLASLAGRSK